MSQSRCFGEFCIYLLALAVAAGSFVVVNVLFAKKVRASKAEVMKAYFLRASLLPAIALAPFLFAGICTLIPASVWHSAGSGSGILLGLALMAPALFLGELALLVVAMVKANGVKAHGVPST